MLLRLRTAFIAICCILSPRGASRAFAQISAAISGVVTDESGARVPSAKIEAVNLETRAQRSTITDASGYYRFAGLRIGQYELNVEIDGFRQLQRKGIGLALGQEVAVDFTLKLGQVQEQITVTEQIPLVSATTADISDLVGERQVKDLPLNGRSYDALMTHNPGLVNFHW